MKHENEICMGKDKYEWKEKREYMENRSEWMKKSMEQTQGIEKELESMYNRKEVSRVANRIWRIINKEPRSNGLDSKSILLTGVHGVGKTKMVQELFRIMDVPLFQLTLRALVSCSPSQVESEIERVFEFAAAVEPCGIFFDDINLIVPNETYLAEYAISLLVALSRSLADHEHSHSRVFVLGACTDSNLVHPLVKKFFQDEIRLEIPGPAALNSIFEFHVRKLNLNFDIGDLVRSCSGYVGADVALICRDAFVLAKNENSEVKYHHFERIISNYQASELGREMDTMSQEMSCLSWDDLAGMDAMKMELFRLIVYPLQESIQIRSLGLSCCREFLFAGAPGTGKSLIIRSLAKKYRIPLIFLSLADVMQSYIGESEKVFLFRFLRRN